MIRLAASLIAFVGGISLVGACSSSNFAGTSAKVASDTSTATGTGTTPTCNGGQPCDATHNIPDPPGSQLPPGTPTTGAPGTPGQCVQGDKANFEWQGDEKTCIVDQGLTYNFDTKACTKIRPAQFTCDWPTVTAELTKRQLLTDKVKAAAAGGSKLVSCGESQDTHRIVVQWLDLGDTPGQDCSFDPQKHHVTTGCYTEYQGTPPPAPTTEAEKEAQVYACLNQI